VFIEVCESGEQGGLVVRPLRLLVVVAVSIVGQSIIEQSVGSHHFGGFEPSQCGLQIGQIFGVLGGVVQVTGGGDVELVGYRVFIIVIAIPE